MRRILLVVSLFFLLPLCANGQETPSAEVFGGYSYLHAETGRDFHGWNGSVSANVNKWLGFVADVSGHYNSDSSTFVVTIPGIPDFSTLPGFPPLAFTTKRNTSIHTVLIGPRFSYRKMEKLTPFAHVLVGLSRIHNELRTNIRGSFDASDSNNDTRFAAAVGAGLDVKLSKSFALRIIQADYLYDRLAFDTHHNFRAGVGIVFRFGDK